MSEETILGDDFLRELMNVGEVDLLVGVPTYNDARTVGQVIQTIRTGLLKYFPRQRAAIINADGGSKDNTQELVRAASISDMQHADNLYALRTLHCISTRYVGMPSSGTALHTIMAASDLLRAGACAVISPDSTSITPEWIQALLQPVVSKDQDWVTPIYRRQKFEGLLIRNLLYPMNRALYSSRVREPYPSDFAFSGRFASHVAGLDSWSEEAARIGAEMYLTIAAITGKFRIVQTYLGPKSRSEGAPADLVAAMRRSVGTLFWSLDSNFPVWSANSQPEAVTTIGPEQEVDPEPLHFNRKRLHDMFSRGVGELEPVLKSILSPGTLGQVQQVAVSEDGELPYTDDLWARTAYEFAAAYHQSVISRDHIVQALAPLYRGRAYTFLVENRDNSPEALESNVEALCLTFERSKPYLLEMWNGRK